MEDLQQKLFTWIDRNKIKAERLLTKLVQQKSVQGKESEAQAIILEKCRQLELEIDIWEPGGKQLKEHPYYNATRNNFNESPNIVGIMKGTGEGKSLILNGHIDIVPEGDEKQWKVDPYSAKIIEGKLYGRGSTDMKGGNVALLMAMQAIYETGIKLKGDIIFQSVIEEESGGTGTLATVLRGYEADAALIPEPTNMKIFPKQQGSMWFRLTVKGRSAHGGTRYEGVSAIEKSTIVIEHIKLLEKKRNKRISDPLYQNIPIPVPINIGKIEGGSWPSSVADEVKLEGRCGIAPNETMDQVKEEFSNWVQMLTEKDSWFIDYPVDLEWFGAFWLPNELSVSHPIIETLSGCFEKVMKKRPNIEASPWGTDGGMLYHSGGIPAVVFGPGVTEVAHFPNEYIEIEKVIQAAKIISLFILQWCEVAEE
ncbi:peptidase [Metabacillus arenae]|uniref:Peptidase n=1 Tax=Metabacillus arenae TaxID=2771434 RepID=A0A926NJZ4_9BACI|nr:peptidase [Metabacillus arenae]MBD1379251.1 peptidase [Metabacillus arenae]